MDEDMIYQQVILDCISTMVNVLIVGVSMGLSYRWNRLRMAVLGQPSVY